jgi:hypothetical protein
MNDTRPIAFGFKDGLLREKDFTGSPFLRFIWRIAEQLYPEEEDDLDKLLDHIAITNVLKCNTVGKNYVDTTPFALVDNCIEVLEEEIRALQPKHIVMFTGRAYDEYIGKLTFGFEPVNITNQTCTKQITDRVEIKHKSVCWWLRDFSENGHAKLRLLRTRHPQGAPLELVNEVVNSVRN